jgi:hypothetical protein
MEQVWNAPPISVSIDDYVSALFVIMLQDICIHVACCIGVIVILNVGNNYNGEVQSNDPFQRKIIHSTTLLEVARAYREVEIEGVRDATKERNYAMFV